MFLISATEIFKNFSGKEIFNNINFTINATDKIGLIGNNGAGKSTLIKILLQQEEIDHNPITNQAGNITKSSGISIGYLAQYSNLNLNHTILQELLNVFNLGNTYNNINTLQQNNKTQDLAQLISTFAENNGYALEAEAKKILTKLNVNSQLWLLPISGLSGGQKTKVMLAKLLLQQNDLLILDEPTNHLDLSSIEWLEEFLQNYPKALLIISHDKYFLNNIINKVFEIENKQLTTYKGDYTEYEIQKEIYLSGALKNFTQQQKQIEKLEQFVLKYKAGVKSKQAKGRQNLLNNLTKLTNPLTLNKNMALNFTIKSPSAIEVLKVTNLSKQYNNVNIFSNVNLKIFKDEKVALIGKNGVGKSTILKIIMQQIQATQGTVEIGNKVSVGYLNQEHEHLNPNLTVLQTITSNFYHIGEEEARNVCGNFLFSNEDVFKLVKNLSGGEKTRLSFILLSLQQPNFLILDEPTNHLDLQSKEILINALKKYNGTLLVVSHDRYFLDSIINKIYIINQTHTTEFSGNYSNYQQHLQTTNSQTTAQNKAEKTKHTHAQNKITERELTRLANKEAELTKQYHTEYNKGNIQKSIEIAEQLAEIEAKFMELSSK